MTRYLAGIALCLPITEGQRYVRDVRAYHRAIADAWDDRWWYGSDWQVDAPIARAREQARRDRLFGVAP